MTFERDRGTVRLEPAAHPGELALVPGSGVWPAIFYAPHQDDEAIGMAGAIREHKAAGRPVVLVLLTNGINDDLLSVMNGDVDCWWHETKHQFGLDMQDLIWARNVEFISSARRLGVDRIHIVDDGCGLDDVTPYRDPDLFLHQVIDVVRGFERRYPGASHKLVSGVRDKWPGGETNPTHEACWNAALALRNEISDFRFYRVYTYGHEESDRRADSVVPLQPAWMDAKRAAIEEYRYFEPDAGRYALGYHSVHDLLDAAALDEHEYLDLLPIQTHSPSPNALDAPVPRTRPGSVNR